MINENLFVNLIPGKSLKCHIFKQLDKFLRRFSGKNLRINPF